MDATRPAPPLVHRYSCLQVRHRAAGCRVCAEACPRQAITLAPGPEVAADCCSGCGVCAALCPTGALEATSPTVQEALAELGAGSLACRRAAGKRGRLPCLGYLDAGLLLLAVARSGTLALDAGPCAACPDARGLAAAERGLAQANAVLAALGQEGRLAFVRERAYAGEPGVSRRALLGLLRRRAEARPLAPEPEPTDPVAKGLASRAWLKPPRRELLLLALAALAALATPPPSGEEGVGTFVQPVVEALAPEGKRRGGALHPPARVPRDPPVGTDRGCGRPRAGGVCPEHGEGGGDEGASGKESPHPHLLPEGEGVLPLPLGEGGGEGPLHPGSEADLTPWPPSLQGKGERGSPPPLPEGEGWGEGPDHSLPFWEVALGEACDGCGMCLTFCPTGALRSERQGAQAAMVFLPEWCLGCGLCAQVCPHAAIDLAPAARLPGAGRNLRAVPIARCGRCGAPYPAFQGETLCPECRQKQRLEEAIRRALFSGKEPRTNADGDGGDEPQMNTDGRMNTDVRRLGTSATAEDAESAETG